MCLFCAVIVDRIPWVAPELLDASDNLTLECDKWSFGATLWEIFNGGNNPLQSWDLKQVLSLLSRIALQMLATKGRNRVCVCSVEDLIEDAERAIIFFMACFTIAQFTRSI